MIALQALWSPKGFEKNGGPPHPPNEPGREASPLRQATTPSQAQCKYSSLKARPSRPGFNEPFLFLSPWASLLTALEQTLKGCVLFFQVPPSEPQPPALAQSMAAQGGRFRWAAQEGCQGEGAGVPRGGSSLTLLMKPHVAGRGRMRKH